jgi:hypothetical protein
MEHLDSAHLIFNFQGPLILQFLLFKGKTISAFYGKTGPRARFAIINQTLLNALLVKERKLTDH